jgi:hypothetical protein
MRGGAGCGGMAVVYLGVEISGKRLQARISAEGTTKDRWRGYNSEFLELRRDSWGGSLAGL